MGWFWKRDNRIEALEERLAKVERAFKELELEWNLAYDKLNSLMGRVAKRAEVIERAAVPASEVDSSSEPQPVEQIVGPGIRLTPRQQEIQKRILSRRVG